MISVIIPAYNAADTIVDCLEAFELQDYKDFDFEVIIVDDGSTDDSRKKALDFFAKSDIKGVVITQKNQGPATARNYGAREAKGEILLFTDADCIVDRHWIKNMVEPFKDEKVVGVSGTYRTLNKDKVIARYVGYEILTRHEKMAGEDRIDWIGTFSAGYRKDIFLRFGGFDENYPAASGEDPELSFRIAEAGYKLVFSKKAYVYHRHPDSLIKYLKQKYSRGYWRVRLYKVHKKKMVKDSYTPRALIPQTAFTGLVFLTLIPVIFNMVHYSSFLILLSILIGTTIPYAYKISKFEKKMAIAVPFIVILRNSAFILGIASGMLANQEEKTIKVL